MHPPKLILPYLGKQNDNFEWFKREQIKYLQTALGKDVFDFLERLEKQRFFSAYITSA